MDITTTKSTLADLLSYQRAAQGAERVLAAHLQRADYEHAKIRALLDAPNVRPENRVLARLQLRDAEISLEVAESEWRHVRRRVDIYPAMIAEARERKATEN